MIRDFCCFTGEWPFYHTPHSDFESLKAIHSRLGIGGGWVSSVQAAFYNDPYEADVRLGEMLREEKKYGLVATVNPMLPGTVRSLCALRERFRVVAVRIHPGFHGYTLNDPSLSPFYAYLRENKLPLCLSVRMEDERVTYFFRPRMLPTDEIKTFLATEKEFPVLLSALYIDELERLKDAVYSRDDVYYDISALKSTFTGDELYKRGLCDRLLLGTLSPVYAPSGNLLKITTACIPNDVKESVLSGERWLDIAGQTLT